VVARLVAAFHRCLLRGNGVPFARSAEPRNQSSSRPACGLHVRDGNNGVIERSLMNATPCGTSCALFLLDTFFLRLGAAAVLGRPLLRLCHFLFPLDYRRHDSIHADIFQTALAASFWLLAAGKTRIRLFSHAQNALSPICGAVAPTASRLVAAARSFFYVLARSVFLLATVPLRVSFASTRVGMGALSADRQVAAMPVPAIRADFNQRLMCWRCPCAVTFHAASFSMTWRIAVDFFLIQVLDLLHGLNFRGVQNSLRTRVPDTVDIRQRDIHVLIARKINAEMRAIFSP